MYTSARLSDYGLFTVCFRLVKGEFMHIKNDDELCFFTEDFKLQL